MPNSNPSPQMPDHEIPVMILHRQQARALMSLGRAIATNRPVADHERPECEWFTNALAALINADPEICRRIQAAGETLR